jgi:poly(3-hydroxybutyrate) depolymerase
MLRVVAAVSALMVSTSTSVSNNVSSQHELLTVYGRQATVFKPASRKVGKAPAIFVLHGSGRLAKDMVNKGFDAIAEKLGFMVVYPEMEIPGAQEWGYDHDVWWFTALHERLQEDDFGMDPERAFICGHSAGGSMSLYLQNEVDLFAAAGAVEAAVGMLQKWDLSKPGRRTMVIWNHADPVLAEYAPWGDEQAYYHQTVATLRRHGDWSWFESKALPTSERILSAAVHHYPKDTAPPLRMVSFQSNPGTHSWANKTWATFSATEELVKFFLDWEQEVDSINPAGERKSLRGSTTSPPAMTAAQEVLAAEACGLALAIISLLTLATIFIRCCGKQTVSVLRRFSGAGSAFESAIPAEWDVPPGSPLYKANLQQARTPLLRS